MIKIFEEFDQSEEALILSDIFEDVFEEFDGKIRWFSSDNMDIIKPMLDIRSFPFITIEAEKSKDSYQIRSILHNLGITDSQISTLMNYNSPRYKNSYKDRMIKIKDMGIIDNLFFTKVFELSNYRLFDIGLDYTHLHYVDISFELIKPES
jgi:hypothetical protein